MRISREPPTIFGLELLLEKRFDPRDLAPSHPLIAKTLRGTFSRAENRDSRGARTAPRVGAGPGWSPFGHAQCCTVLARAAAGS